MDVNPGRLQSAAELGADVTLIAGADLPERLKKANEGRLAEVVIVATGARPALEQAFQMVDKGGEILFFAPSDPGAELPMPFNDLWRKEITMTSTYAGSPRDIMKAIELIASGRINVDAMITHRLPLDRIVEGFSLVRQAGQSMKVVILPQE